MNNAEVPGKMGPLPWLFDRDFYRIFSVNVVGMAKVCSLVKYTSILKVVLIMIIMDISIVPKSSDVSRQKA